MPRSASGRRNRWVEEGVGAGATYEVDVALCGVRAKARVGAGVGAMGGVGKDRCGGGEDSKCPAALFRISWERALACFLSGHP